MALPHQLYPVPWVVRTVAVSSHGLGVEAVGEADGVRGRDVGHHTCSGAGAGVLGAVAGLLWMHRVSVVVWMT